MYIRPPIMPLKQAACEAIHAVRQASPVSGRFESYIIILMLIIKSSHRPVFLGVSSFVASAFGAPKTNNELNPTHC